MRENFFLKYMTRLNVERRKNVIFFAWQRQMISRRGFSMEWWDHVYISYSDYLHDVGLLLFELVSVLCLVLHRTEYAYVRSGFLLPEELWWIGLLSAINNVLSLSSRQFQYSFCLTIIFSIFLHSIFFLSIFFSSICFH